MPPAFQEILDALRSEHVRQVQELQQEINHLRKVSIRQQSKVAFAENTSDTQAIVDGGFQLQPNFTSASVLPSLSGYTESMPISSSAGGSSEDSESIPMNICVSSAGRNVHHPHEFITLTRSVHIMRMLPAKYIEPTTLIPFIPSKVKLSSELWWRSFCESIELDIIISAIIIVNTFIMAWQIQCDGIMIGHSIGFPGYISVDGCPGIADFFKIAENFFVVFYTVEFLFKLAVLRCAFFRHAWNWLDLIVAVTGVLTWISAAGHRIDPKLLRVVRLCKLSRGLRVFKLGRFCDALQLLISSISASLSTLFWSLLVLIMFQCIAAMFMNQLLSSYFDDPEEDDNHKREVFVYYGTFLRSCVTMFEIVLANWATPCRVITARVGEIYGMAILTYRCTFGFSVLNVVSAVFIQQTMKLMSSHTDIMLMEKRRTEAAFKNKLETLLEFVHIPKDTIISRSELSAKLHNAEASRYCFGLGIDQHDLEDIFHLFRRQDGMTREEFLEAALKIRREARTIDVARLLVHSKKMGLQLDAIRDSMLEMSLDFGKLTAHAKSDPHHSFQASI